MQGVRRILKTQQATKYSTLWGTMIYHDPQKKKLYLEW